MTVPDGFGIIAGRGRENAQAAIAAAVAAGFEPEIVRTQKEGYLVPLKVLDKYEELQGKTKEAPEEAPKAKPLTAAQKKAAAKKAAKEAEASAEVEGEQEPAAAEVEGEPGIVIDENGVEHVGELPVEAAAATENPSQLAGAETTKEA